MLMQDEGVEVEVVTLGEGSEMAIIDAVDSAERENSWIVIHNLHLSSTKFFKDLRYHITRITRRRGKH